jgi:RNA polymerase sigma-70 factor, ECF subfamily
VAGDLTSEELSAAWGGAGAVPDAALETCLRAYLSAARSAWPELGVDDAEFVRHVAARATEGAVPPSAHAADLLLACACSRGLGPAITAFQRVYGPVIDRVFLHRKAATHLADDARQIVQERLLVGDVGGAAPKIALYSGAGPLKSWVATAAARTLLMLYRSTNRRREAPEEAQSDALGVQLDPELELLKGRYQTDVEEAIVHALSQLGDRERTLLRLHLSERMSIDALGTMYAVNRATAARWLAAARQTLLQGARERLRERLRLSETECDSAIALVNSRLDVSIVRRLSEPG